MSVFYVDGRFVDSDEAVIPVNDLALLRGYGAFDFLRTYGNKPFELEAHVQRLKRSCELIGLAFPWSARSLMNLVRQTLDRNDHGESNIRLVVTGGGSLDSISPIGDPRLLIMVTPVPELPASWYRDGAKVVTVDIERFIPGSKSINYIPAIVALNRARENGAMEALYTDRKGRVLEGTMTNFFIFSGSELITPGEGILPGVTRQAILDICSDRFSVRLGDVTRETLYGAEEVFLTASNKEVVPIVRVDDRVIADGNPGPRTREVMDLFRQYTHQFSGGAGSPERALGSA